MTSQIHAGGACAENDSLFPYQREGANFLAQRDAAFLWDDQGLGKTIQAVAACDLVKARRVVVLCPAAVKENWAREFSKWAVYDPISGDKQSVAYGRSFPFKVGAGVRVLNYDLLAFPKMLESIRLFDPDVVILDEAHFLKNPRAKRTKAVFGRGMNRFGGVTERARHIWALTATPIPNNPSELWSCFRAMAPEALESGLPGRSGPLDFESFTKRFCLTWETNYGLKIGGGRNFEELRERIAPYILRRRRAEVLPQLPPLRMNYTPLSSADAAKRVRAESKNNPAIAELIEWLSAAQSDEEVQKAMQEAQGGIATLRRTIGLLKAPLVADLVEEELEGGLEKIVIFAQHKAVMDLLAERLSRFGVVQVRGDVTGQKRQEGIDAFQGDPNTRVLIGQIQAAGTGITLTAAADLLFAELSWVPAENKQATMRVYRIGQKKPVTVRIAVLPGTVDEKVSQACLRKITTINQILNPEEGE